ncbi:MAG: NAD(P)/FAD-dependent oxidoreductase [Bacteroidales bacterium]|nr:NAD(P)/FAD-dependent oxidoreductase [Bacteroidales bacterium]
MDTEITIIGAGVIGLAIGEKISEKYKDVFLIEKHPTFGQETSSRNSEVIHAGIYYPPGSLKARLCVEGKDLLYEYCRNNDIPFNKCGKLVVATSPEEIPVITKIRENAYGNGVDLSLLDRDQIARIEPEVFALKALYSPTTGIVDTHSLMKRFETNILNNGGQIVYGSEVTGIKRTGTGYEITILDADKRYYRFTSRILINSAGLTSDKISEIAGIKDNSLKHYFCKGEYFKVNPPKNRLVKRLIYPVPHPDLEGTGVHVTIDMAGGLKLGPDISYIDSDCYDYKVSGSKQEDFWRSAKKFLPFLEYEDIVPEMAGIRPKLQREGTPTQDFYIKEETGRGYAGLINLIGMESPGLTACIAIANYVMNLIKN